MNRRAFGLVQLFAIFILLLAAIIFVVVAVVNYKSNEPLAPEAAADLKNVPATIFLHNLLITPADTPSGEVKKFVPHPTIGDLIALDENVSDELAAIMAPIGTAMGTGFSWTVRINGIPVSILQEGRYVTTCKVKTAGTMKIVPGYAFLRENAHLRQSTATIPSSGGEKSVTFHYCIT